MDFYALLGIVILVLYVVLMTRWIRGGWFRE